MNCDNVLPEMSQNQMTPSPGQPLYYPEELEPSLLIGEEIELRTHSQSSDTSDTDSNGEASTEEDPESVVTDDDLWN